MQKKIIALAVAGLVSGAAFAQSNVTIYGSADMSYTYASGDFSYKNANPANTDDRTFSGMTGGQWNGNRIGFRGMEDLGNGLKAVFTYEYGTDLNSNGGFSGVRQAFVGLDTKFGQFSAGRQYAPSGAIMGKNSAFDIASTTPLNNILSRGGQINSGLGLSTMGTGNTSRWNNSIAFISKDYSGFSARAIYSFSNTTSGVETAGLGVPAKYESDYNDNGRFGISGSYANGPFNVDVIYQTVMNARQSFTSTNTSAAGQGDDINEWFIGGAWDFKVAKVFATYASLANKNDKTGGLVPLTSKGYSTVGTATQFATNSDSAVWSVGVSVPVSAAGKIRAEYASISFDKNQTGGLNGSSSGYGIGYTHDFSKRTMFYTSVAYMDNDKDSDSFGVNNLSTGAQQVGQSGNSNWSFTTGLRHFF